MKVFVTGAGGYIGAVLTNELIQNGHQVVGFTRSDKSAKIIRDAGGEVVQGSIENLDLLKKGAKEADGVVHLALNIDDMDFKKALRQDREAITALAEGLAESGTGKPLVLTSGGLLLPKGQISNEDTPPDRDNMFGERAESEDLVKTLSREKGVRGSVVRLAPVVHSKDDKFFIIWMMGSARKEGFVTLSGENSRWPAVHRSDAAELFRLALEKGKAGSIYHAMAENAPVKDIVETISKRMNVPVKKMSFEEAQAVLGFMAFVQDRDCAASADKTKAELGWTPTGPTLLEDMEENYF